MIVRGIPDGRRFFSTRAALLLLLFLAHTASADWPMHRGGPELQGRASGSLPASPELLWRFETGGPVRSSVAVADGTAVFGSSDGIVYAVRASDGLERWRFTTEAEVEATPCIVAGTVYVGSADGFLYALDLEDGSMQWKYETGGLW